jgi:DNA-binding transcriptional MerR regulator
LYTRQEAGELLGLTVSGVRGLEARGVLEGTRRGNRWVFTAADIQRAKANTRAGKREQTRQKIEALHSPDPGEELAQETRTPEAPGPSLDPLIASAFAMLESRKRPMDLVLELHFTPQRVRDIVEQYRDILSLSSANGNSDVCIRCRTQPACVCLECAAPASSRGAPASSRGAPASEPSSSSSSSQEGAPEASGGGSVRP